MLNKSHDQEVYKQQILHSASYQSRPIQRIARCFLDSFPNAHELKIPHQIKLFTKTCTSVGVPIPERSIICKLFSCSTSSLRRAEALKDAALEYVPDYGGRPTKLSLYIQGQLITWIKQNIAAGNSPSRRMVTIHALSLLSKEDPDATISPSWIDNFLKAEATPIKIVTLEPLEPERFDVETRIIIEWFELLGNISAISISPKLFMNLDETGFGASTIKKAKKKKVIIPIEDEVSPYYRLPRTDGHISAICTISADGKMSKIGLIGKNKSLHHDATMSTFYKNALYYSTETAFITTVIYEDYIKNSILPFVEKQRKELPDHEQQAILIVDGLKAHFSKEIEAVLALHNILYVSIPPHSSNFVQPLDRHFFSRVKEAYMRKGYRKDLCHYTAGLERVFQAIEESYTEWNIIVSFRRAGIIPVLEEGEVTKLRLDMGRIISVQTGHPYTTLEEYEKEHPMEEFPKGPSKKTNKSKWGIWNEEQMHLIKDNKCPLCCTPGAYKQPEPRLKKESKK